MVEFNLNDLAGMFDTGTESSQKFFDKVKEGTVSAGDAISGFITEVSNISTSTKEAGEEVKKFFEFMAGFKTSIDNLVSFTENLHFTNDELKTMLGSVTNIGLVLASGLHPEAFDDLAKGADGTTASLTKTVDTIGKMSGLLSILPGGDKLKGFVDAMKPFASLADKARDFESGMLMAASASGELGDLLHEVGEDMSGLEQKMVTFTKLTEEIGTSSGISTAEVGKFASQLMKIPGALSTTIDLTSDGAEQIHQLDAMMKLASGTGQTFQAVFERVNHVYLEFGTTGKNASEYVSRLSAASQGLKMPLELVRTYAEGAAQSFRFFGDNSQGAINILGRFGPALKESGLGPRAIADLTQNITKNISDMGIAQRAFVSQTSGGTGGLQGGYQIELLKQQGKIDEVEKLVETSLRKQFGGRVVTLEEGAQSQAAAAQLTKEVQLLTSGPTKIANSEGEAYKILEAMSKGTSAPAAAQIKSPEEALKAAVDTGNSFQQRNYNATVVLTNWAEKQTMLAAISANNLTRMATGQNSPLVKQMIDQLRQEGGEKAATRKIITGSGAEAPPEQDVNEALRDSFYDMMNKSKLVVQSVSKGMDNVSVQHSIKAKDKAANDAISARYHAPASLTSNRRVAHDLNTPGSPVSNPAGGPLPGPGHSGETIIKVTAVCEKCNAKIAEDTALRVVDGKIVKMQRDQINHAHGSYTF